MSARRLPVALLLLLGLVVLGHSTGAVPNGHFDPEGCYDPSNPDPEPGDGVFEASLLGTMVHLVVTRSSVFVPHGGHCGQLDPRL